MFIIYYMYAVVATVACSKVRATHFCIYFIYKMQTNETNAEARDV